MADQNANQAKTTQKPDHTYMVLSYDLVTPPGMQDEFKKEMIAKKWNYTWGGKDLPRSTCFTSFPNRMDVSKALAVVQDDIDKVEKALQAQNKNFRVERRLISVYQNADSETFFSAIK